MAVCRVYQIPHSHFLGGPPVWTSEDQDKAVAYEQMLSATCGSCKTRLDQWEGDPFAFVGHNWRCPGCEVLEQERDNVPEDAKGVQVGLIPREVALAQAKAEARRAAERER